MTSAEQMQALLWHLLQAMLVCRCRLLMILLLVVGRWVGMRLGLLYHGCRQLCVLTSFRIRLADCPAFLLREELWVSEVLT